MLAEIIFVLIQFLAETIVYALSDWLAHQLTFNYYSESAVSIKNLIENFDSSNSDSRN